MSRYRTSARPALVLALLLALILPGCQSANEGSARGDRIVHGDGEGPLRASGDGGNSIIAPKRTPWAATFGAYPCTRTGKPIVIERVRYEYAVQPLSSRVVAFVAERSHGATGIGSAVGSPESQLGPGRNQVLGKILGSPNGLKVTESCHDSSPRRALQLLTVLKVGRRGGEVSHFSIDYSTEGREYSLAVSWQMVACGSKTSRDMCPKDL